MIQPSDSDSESSRSISTSERKRNARPSTSRSLGSSGPAGPLPLHPAAVSPSRSANPAAGALATPATRARLLPRARLQTPPRAPFASVLPVPADSELPSVMSSTQTQTVTSTAAESGLRVAASGTYRYAAATLHFPERTTQAPARRNALIVNAIATPAGSGSSSAPYGSMHDRHAYSYSQSYSQIGYSSNDSQSQSQSQSQSSSQVQAHSTWSMTISDDEIPAQPASAEADSTARSSLSGYGRSSAEASGSGFVPTTILPTEHGHVGYYSGAYGSASVSGSVAEASEYRPPSLASYALTPPAAQASTSTWRETAGDGYGWPASSQTFRALDSDRQRVAQWELPSSATAGPSRTSFSLEHPAFPPADSSPTHTNSPESATGAASSSWAPIPPATVIESDDGTRSQSSRPYANKVLPTNTMARPSLTRSALGSSSSSSSSLHVSSFAAAASGASGASAAAPTSATPSIATTSHVPEPATPFSLPSYTLQSLASPSRLTGIVSEPSAPYSRLPVGYIQTAVTTTNADVVSPSSTTGARDQAHSSPQHGSETHSPASSRLAYTDASPVNERRHYHEPDAAALRQSGYSGQSLMESTSEAARASTSFGSDTLASGTSSGSRGANYGFTDTNTSAYSGPRGVQSDSDPGTSSLPGRSGSSASQLTVPVTISAAQPYEYPYTSPSTASAAVVAGPQASASAIASTSGAGSSGSQSTRKRNHPCWMCHKSFDRPSTLRKHLLVHTGEKAYVCNICGRRFGVASNLNRHTRRCISRPVNSAAFHSASGSSSVSVSASAAGPSTSGTTLTASQAGTMAREQTNPDVRQSERERDGREVREGDQPPPAPATPTASSESSSRSRTVATVPRRRGRSTIQTPLGGLGINASSVTPDSQASSQQTSYPLRPGPAFDSGTGTGTGQGSSSGSGSSGGGGQVAVATASTSTNTGEAETERRPKRRRRAPSPSRWVPQSLRNFSLSPVRQRTSTPLPPVSPGYDATTGSYEERDSYATITDENVDPSGEASGGGGETSNAARSRAERLRNFEYAPYHPCGWTGRLPGPAVVGNDVTNYTKSAGGSGTGSGGHYSGGGNTGGGISFMYEFSLAAAG